MSAEIKNFKDCQFPLICKNCAAIGPCTILARHLKELDTHHFSVTTTQGQKISQIKSELTLIFSSRRPPYDSNLVKTMERLSQTAAAIKLSLVPDEPSPVGRISAVKGQRSSHRNY